MGLFRALICSCGRRQAPTGALTQPATPQDAQHPHCPACPSSVKPVAPVLGLSVQADMSRSESLAGTSSKERVTCLILSMPGLASPHRRQGCPALSHTKFSPAFSLPSLIVRNKNSIWAIKRQHLLNVCRLPETGPGSPFLLRLT